MSCPVKDNHNDNKIHIITGFHLCFIYVFKGRAKLSRKSVNLIRIRIHSSVKHPNNNNNMLINKINKIKNKSQNQIKTDWYFKVTNFSLTSKLI